MSKRLGEFFKLSGMTVLIALSYFLAAKLGLKLAVINNNSSPVWPASGLAIAALILFGTKHWPAILIGAFAANLTTGSPVLSVCLIAVGNTLEAIIGAQLYKRVSKLSTTLNYHTSSISFLAISMFPTTVSAVVGTFALYCTNVISFQAIGEVWLTWWTGDFLGVLVVTPFLLELFQPKKNEYTASKLFEFFLYAISCLAITYFSFSNSAGLPLMFLVFIMIFVSTFRLTTLLTSAIVILCCASGIYVTSLGVGPFKSADFNLSLLHLQLFLASLAIAVHVLQDLRKSGGLNKTGLVYILGCALSTILFNSFNISNVKKDAEHFSELQHMTTQAIKERMRDYSETLRAGSAFIAANGEISKKQWRDFTSTLNLGNRMPGLNGIGVVFPVKNKDLDSHLRKFKKLGLTPDYKVKYLRPLDKSTSAEPRYLITYLEPEKINEKAIGLDLSSEERRKTAADLARDTGEASITSQITLVQDEKKRPGFLLFVPIYNTDHNFLRTSEERRAAFIGWVYAPFIMDKFLTGIFGNSLKEIGFSLSEGFDFDKNNPIYTSHTISSDKVKYEEITRMELAQSLYSIGWVKTSDFVTTKNSTTAWAAACAIIVTLLLTSFISNLQSVQIKAHQLAEELTKELRESETLLNEAQAIGKVGFVRSNFITNERYWTKEMYKIWDFDSNYPPPAIDTILQKVIVEDREKFQINMNKALNSEKLVIAEFSINISSTQIKELKAELLQLKDENDKVVGIKGIVRDVTAINSNNKELEEQRQKLVYASKMSTLGEMAAGISHEINNPLAIISGKAALLKNSFLNNTMDPKKAVDDLDKIQQTTFRISKIIKGLKAFARNSDRDKLESVNYMSTVNDTLELCQARFKSHGVELDLKLATETKIHCSTTQISQVLLNLLNNSFDAIEKEKDKWIRLETKVQGDFLQFAVTDCGKGILPEILEKMMQPFFTTKEVGKGTGLGLSISKGIVEQHGGKFWYDNKSIHTRFCFTIPLAKVESKLAA